MGRGSLFKFSLNLNCADTEEDFETSQNSLLSINSLEISQDNLIDNLCNVKLPESLVKK